MSDESPLSLVGTIPCAGSEDLPDWVAKRLPPAHRERVSAHLAACASCRDEAALLASVLPVLQAVPVPPMNVAAIVAALPAAPQTHPLSARRTAWLARRVGSRGATGRRVVWGTLAAAAGMVFWLAVPSSPPGAPRGDTSVYTAAAPSTLDTVALLEDPVVDPLLDLLNDLEVTLQ